ncbi:hypothetical protein [Halobacillus sp. B23F22_1]|uniref:hypothetical protein n=1 Tax=Halobacillus sp. B23F22_1 TaxID=3459514 RepID=UPI00373F8345
MIYVAIFFVEAAEVKSNDGGNWKPPERRVKKFIYFYKKAANKEGFSSIIAKY